MYDVLRATLLWVLAAGGVLIFAWYVFAAGFATLDSPSEPPVLKPDQLTAFGIAAGSLLATNLGAVLGIAVQPPDRGFRAFRDSQRAAWARLGGAVLYLVLLGVALFFYWQSDWSEDAAEVLTTSVSTLFGVFLGAMTAVFSPKP